MQPAQFAIEIDKPRRDADGFAAALESRLGIEEGIRERIIESTKTSFALTGRGKVEQCLFCPLDLVARRIIEVLSESVIYDILAQCNQLAPKVEIVDNTTIILGVYDCYCCIRKPSQILCTTNFTQRTILIKQIL